MSMEQYYHTKKKEIVGAYMQTRSKHTCSTSITFEYNGLDECLKENTRKIGSPKLTWIDQIKRDLAQINIYPDSNFDNIIKLAENRDSWRNDIVNTNSHTLHNSGQPLAMVHLQKEGSAQV